MVNYKIWQNEKLGHTIVIDTETTIADFHTRGHKLVLFQAYDGTNGYIVRKKDVKSFLLTNYHATLVGQNIKFDVQVLAHEVGWNLLYRWYDRNKIHDTKIMFQLWHLAYEGHIPHSGTSLKDLMSRFFNIKVDKSNDIRMTFGQYLDKPVEDIPEEWITYAMNDVYYTYKLYTKLLDLIESVDSTGKMLSLDIQMKGDLALDQIYKNGIGVDLDAVEKKKEEIKKDLSNVEKRLSLWGYIKGRVGVKDVYERIMVKLGLDKVLPRSPKTKRISSKEEDLRPYKNLAFVSDFVEFCQKTKLISYLLPLDKEVAHPRYTAILNSGRTSCSACKTGGGINLQQLPRTGGVRECFVPKTKGNVFVDIDYSSIELSAIAQLCYSLFGYSRIKDLINTNKDLHTATAAAVFEVDGGDLTKQNKGKVLPDQRQFAKIVNFGFNGGMGPAAFARNAKTQGFDITEERAKEVRDKYLETYPEIAQYFKEPEKHAVGQQNDWEDSMYKHTTLTGRVRTNCSYSAFLNIGFQGIAADGLKLALYRTIKEGYHVVAEIHDQIVVECPKKESQDVMDKVSIIMIEEMQKVIPDVKISVEGNITERLEK